MLEDADKFRLVDLSQADGGVEQPAEPGSEDSPPASGDSTPADGVSAADVTADARVRLKSLDLPEAGSLTDEQKQAVRDLAKRQLAGRPQSFIAVAVGTSTTAMRDLLAGKTRRDEDALLRKVNSWIDDDERRRRRNAPLGFFETNVFLSMRDAAVYAKSHARTSAGLGVNAESSRIVLVHGPSGIGKSAGVRALAAWDPNAIAIRLVERSGSAAGVARAIAASESWRGLAARSSGTLIEDVMHRLEHSGRLLIVDEAHRLSGSGYEFMRDLADVAGIPILLVATPRIQRRVDGPRMGLGGALDDQFSRRVALVVDLLRGSDGRGGSKRPIFTVSEIVKIFNSDRVRLKVTDDAVEFLQAVACMIGGGMLGQAYNIFEKARVVALRGNCVVDGRLLRAAAERVLSPAGVRNDVILRSIESQLTVNRQLADRAARAAAG